MRRNCSTGRGYRFFITGSASASRRASRSTNSPVTSSPRAAAPTAIRRPTFTGPSADRLQALADWIVQPDNPFFARAQANRVWYHLMGRGIVEPNDDFRASNPPVNGPLLETLTQDFIAHRFDLRHLVRTIMNSRIYQ